MQPPRSSPVWIVINQNSVSEDLPQCKRNTNVPRRLKCINGVVKLPRAVLKKYYISRELELVERKVRGKYSFNPLPILLTANNFGETDTVSSDKSECTIKILRPLVFVALSVHLVFGRPVEVLFMIHILIYPFKKWFLVV